SRSWRACGVARGLPTSTFLRELRFTQASRRPYPSRARRQGQGALSCCGAIRCRPSRSGAAFLAGAPEVVRLEGAGPIFVTPSHASGRPKSPRDRASRRREWYGSHARRLRASHDVALRKPRALTAEPPGKTGRDRLRRRDDGRERSVRVNAFFGWFTAQAGALNPET